ncbi:MAG: glycoside hydrolase family 13 protein [Saprospiraceae bacterium]|nr:glycoside hydrolase family 13 protein [Saprospiraceae bacterium]
MTQLVKLTVLLLLILRGGIAVHAQAIDIQKVHPLNWYVGVLNPNLQILIYGKNISASKVSLKPYAGVSLQKVHTVENPNYLFLDLTIDKTAQAGALQFVFSKNGETLTRSYELKNRSAKPQGLSSSDLVYLIMPDRFANGDPSNDRFTNLKDTLCDRTAHSLRHGGDLKGVIDHLDYLNDLGATALWLTPVLENNMSVTSSDGRTYSSYHGYAFTDHYQVDPRLGGNETYLQFTKAVHAKGLKVVQDAVYNHCGSDHWFFKDLPMRDWVNQWDTYTSSSHRNQTLLDPYASFAEKKLMSDGWFVRSMPDLNQRNPYLATYLIQHAIWSTEYFGIDAWRIDTYMYCDLEFMNRCNQALMDEFPNIFMFGESWVGSVLNQAYFVRNNLNLPFKSNQLGGCDFQVCNAIKEALTTKVQWNEGGANKLFQTLAQDFVYQDATKNVIFFENHDTDRFLHSINNDAQKFKMAMVWLLTLRGIPQIYYGTEIGMNKSRQRSDGDVREDFMGGWSEDKVNKFTEGGRTNLENTYFDIVKKLANYRKQSKALTEGKMMQFGPRDGVYVYFRYTNNEKVMIITNTNDKEKTIKTDFCNEILRGGQTVRNVLTDEKFSDLNAIKIPAGESWVLEVK